MANRTRPKQDHQSHLVVVASLTFQLRRTSHRRTAEIITQCGGSGIGQAVCARFWKEGAKVIVADANETSAKSTYESLGDGCSSYFVDVGESKSVNSLIREVLAKYQQPPSILVNCAGITRDNFLTEMDEKSFDDVIRVNLKGTFLMIQGFSKEFIKAGAQGGSIINLGSLTGKTGNMGQINYAASKAGVEGITKTTAKELAKFGIRCNTVLPGMIRTPMIATVPEKVIQKWVSAIPLGRAGEPEDVADLCLFLASDNSSYITGVSIEVTGGLGF